MIFTGLKRRLIEGLKLSKSNQDVTSVSKFPSFVFILIFLSILSFLTSCLSSLFCKYFLFYVYRYYIILYYIILYYIILYYIILYDII